VFDGIPNANELLQLGELEFIRKDAVQNVQNKVCRDRHLRLGYANGNPGTISPLDL